MIAECRMRAAIPEVPKFKVQRFLYNNLLPILFPHRLHLSLEQRMTKLCPGTPFGLASADMTALQGLMQQIAPGLSFSIFKTWLNAWTTSARLQESSQHGCLAGCPAEPDDLRHYLRCPRLWTSLQAATEGLPDPCKQTACGRLALDGSPNLSTLRRLATVCKFYHACRHNLQLRRQLLALAADRDFLQLAARCRSVLEAAACATATGFPSS